MIKVGITGNIASGKSQVEKILLSLGFKVVDCDEINKNLLLKDNEIINKIRIEFGNEIFNKEGIVSKEKLGKIVFNNPNKKQKLENILHQRILNEINSFFEQSKEEKIVFVSAALLFEAQWENYFDKIIFVSASDEIRLKRLIERNNYTLEHAQKRLNAQNNEKEKIKKSDFVIINNSDIENLKKSVLEIISGLI